MRVMCLPRSKLYAEHTINLDASFLGFAVLGLCVLAAGSLVVIKALQALKKESLVPEKTVEK
jgi:hypothetical protein